MSAAGNYIIAWLSRGQDGSGDGIYAQRYSAAGVPQDGEFRVNTTTNQAQRFPSVAMSANGDFVIAWYSFSQDGSGTGIYAQRYNAAGVPQGGEFQVNTFTENHQDYPSVAMDGEGDFVIAWESFGQDGSRYGVYAQRYDAAGAPQGSEFRVNTFTSIDQRVPSVGMNANGDFVIVWTSDFQDGSGDGIFAQRYNAAGMPQGGEFQVNTLTINNQYSPSVALDADGDFVIAWDSADGSNYGVYAQRYNAAGVPQGGEFRVNTYTNFIQRFSSVALESGGDFVIAWHSDPQDGSSYGVYARRYDAVGAPQGGEFRINTRTMSAQSRPKVAMDADGDFVIAWSSYNQDGSGSGVYAQRYIQGIDPIVDNIEPGFSLSGEWAPGGGPGVGRNGNVYVAFGEPWQTDTATWTFNLSGPGRYRVSATWYTNLGFPHLFTDVAPFSVTDTAAGLVRGTALVNQKVFPNDFSDAGSDWEDLGVFDIIGSSFVVQLTSTSDNATYVVADAIRIERLADLPSAAEIQVTESGFDVADNSGNVSFGAAELMAPIARIFEISNLGSQTLQLTLPVTVPPGFTLTSPPALTALAPGQSTAFTVRLDAALPGAYSGPVSFANSDTDENPFNFNITGTVLASRILDDGQPGYAHNGLFTSGATSVNRDGDVSYAVGGPATASQASWTFNVPPGQYRVAATWIANSPNWATNAPFTVLDGATALATVPINQRQSPVDFAADGSMWNNVGGTFNISGPTLTVQLSNVGADGYVIADAVRIERIGDLNGNPEAPGGNGAMAPLVVRGSPDPAPPVDRRSPSAGDEETYGRAGGTVGRPYHNEMSSAEGLLTTAYWTDDLEDLVTVVAEAIASRDLDNLDDDPAANGRMIQPEHEPLDLALSDWQV